MIASGCSLGPEGEKSIVLSGMVVQKSTQAPVDSAWVSLTDSTNVRDYTDSAGRFRIPSFAVGHGRLFAGKSGFRTASKTLENVYRDLDSILMELELAE